MFPKPDNIIPLVDWTVSHLNAYTDHFGARYGHKLAADWRVEDDPKALRLSNLIQKMIDLDAMAAQAAESRVA